MPSAYKSAATKSPPRGDGKLLNSPVAWWAGLGLVVLAFEAYVFSRWVTGPYFTPVPPGPTPIPLWMKTVLEVWQVVGLFVATFVVYWFLVRPWRREGRVTTDGLLVVAIATVWFQDPLSSYFGHWMTYNAYLVNFGSWVHDVPGWQSYGKPGQMLLEPILLIGPVYIYFIMIATVFGCFLMREAKSRWPNLRTPYLIALCYLAMALVDLVGEGLIWLPLGFWEYPGGIPFLFTDTYHKYPLNEMLTIAAFFTTIICLRYFRDDRGHTIVERGIEKLGTGRRRTALRFLAMIGAIHLIIFVCYTLPNSLIYKFEFAWPEDLQQRSYLMDSLCGPGTANLCPGDGHGFVVGGRTP